MRKNAVIYSSVFTVVLLIASSVFAQKVPFVPLLPQDSLIVASKFPVRGAIGDSAAYSAQAVAAISHAAVREGSQIFRIQLLTGNQFAEASFARKVAEEIFALPVEVAYDAPYYKIRIGEFASRDEAERYLPKVQSVGYPNAIVVAAIAGIQKAAPAYDTTETTDSTVDSTKGK